MKGLILAAGDGGRLHPLTLECPKILLKVGERHLISYPLEAMARAGISDVAVVVGHQAEYVMNSVKRIAPIGIRLEFVFNGEHEGGNAISVSCAETFMGGDDFVLCMGDHIIDPTFVKFLLEGDPEAPLLAVDRVPTLKSQIDDATRVSVDVWGHITAIGKNISNWDAVDTGVFLLNSDLFGVVKSMRKEFGNKLELNQVVQYMADHLPPFATKDIDGLFWTDVDTEEDYRGAGHSFRLFQSSKS